MLIRYGGGLVLQRFMLWQLGLPAVRRADPLPYPRLKVCTQFTILKILTVHLLLSVTYHLYLPYGRSSVDVSPTRPTESSCLFEPTTVLSGMGAPSSRRLANVSSRCDKVSSDGGFFSMRS